MDDSHRKAQETRLRNLETRSKLMEEQRAAVRAARTALTKLMEREDASPGEILRASELLVELSKP